MNPPGFRCAVLAIVVSIVVGSSAASALLIDDFSANQAVVVLTPDVTAESQQAGSGILGGERDVVVTRTSGIGVSAFALDGGLSYGHLADSRGTGLFTWDGPDASAALDPTGLGGLDFTEGGTDGWFALYLVLNDLGVPLQVTVYTDAGNFSTATLLTPGGIPPGAPSVLTLAFSAFLPVAGAGADFTNVGALSLLVAGSATPALDLGIESFATVPEPGSGLLLAAGMVGLSGLRRRSGRRGGRH